MIQAYCRVKFISYLPAYCIHISLRSILWTQFHFASLFISLCLIPFYCLIANARLLKKWKCGKQYTVVPKYQPGIIVIVNVMMLAFISKPHRAEFLLFFLFFRFVFLNKNKLIYRCKTVFVLLTTNPTLDSSACMSRSSVPVHFSATRHGWRKFSKPNLNQNLFPWLRRKERLRQKTTFQMFFFFQMSV